MAAETQNPAVAHGPASDAWESIRHADLGSHMARHSVDSSEAPDEIEYKLRNVAIPTARHTLQCWHVTDDPDVVLRELKAGSDLSRSPSWRTTADHDVGDRRGSTVRRVAQPATADAEVGTTADRS